MFKLESIILFSQTNFLQINSFFKLLLLSIESLFLTITHVLSIFSNQKVCKIIFITLIFWIFVECKLSRTFFSFILNLFFIYLLNIFFVQLIFSIFGINTFMIIGCEIRILTFSKNHITRV